MDPVQQQAMIQALLGQLGAQGANAGSPMPPNQQVPGAMAPSQGGMLNTSPGAPNMNAPPNFFGGPPTNFGASAPQNFYSSTY